MKFDVKIGQLLGRCGIDRQSPAFILDRPNRTAITDLRGKCPGIIDIDNVILEMENRAAADGVKIDIMCADTEQEGILARFSDLVFGVNTHTTAALTEVD